MRKVKKDVTNYRAQARERPRNPTGRLPFYTKGEEKDRGNYRSLPLAGATKRGRG